MPAPPLDPPPLGMLELEPPPELPDEPDEPEEPDDPPGLGIVGEGMPLEEEEESTQPPTRNTDVAVTSVVWVAMTNSRRREWRLDIA
jgi:hypothetical protein